MTSQTEPKTRQKPGRKAKPRERDASGLSVDEAHREGITMGDTRDPNTKVAQERVRIPMNAGQKLSLRGYNLDTKAYHYHWFHESPSRPGTLVDAKGAFYEHCQIDGQNVVTPSGSGTDYLMRLPIKYHLEDMQAAKDKRAKMRQSQTAVGKGEYAPTTTGREGGHSSVVHSSTSTNPYQ
jgi:hypothetical protein